MNVIIVDFNHFSPQCSLLVPLKTFARNGLSRRLLNLSFADIFLELGVLKNFAIFTGKHLCCSLYLTKLQACNFIKKNTQTKVFSCEYCKKILRKPFFTEYLRRLFLYLCTKEWYLTHSMPLATFYNPWKHQKIPGVLFSRVLKETSDMN